MMVNQAGATPGEGGTGRDGTGAGGALGAEAYRALYEFSPYGVLFTAPDGRVLAANPAACEILGRTEAEICTLGRQGMADDSDPRWAPLLAERARAGQTHGIARMIRGDGSTIEVEMSARVFSDPSGAPRTCTVIRDITARASIERELRRSRQALVEAERVARMGSWEWDMREDRTTWSDGLFELYGLSVNELDATYEGGIERVLPEDRQRVREAMERAVAERSGFALEYRVVRRDGRVRTFRNQGEVVVDERGTPVRVVGVVRDVTEAKLVELALQSTSADLERRAGELQRLASAASAEPAATHALLTARQLEIVQLIAQGLTNAAIAERLFVTEGTVKWHVKQILARTGSANRAEVIARVLGPPGTEDLSMG
ncbi:MAG TPA: PAS domain-containing protein [Solirubrobacteraceae bacterium]|nr:PAS domain-containing protein [Solirubrobacteraceae bacterium]